MIYITSDIHHERLRTGNQAHSDINEIELSVYFCRLLEKYDLKATYFITGKTLSQEPEITKKIFEFKNIEIGGHTFSAFSPELPHRIWKKLTGNYNGPYIYEYLDVYRTKKIIKKYTGQEIKVWRNHMYMHGKNTNKILNKLGIELCSDGVKKGSIDKNNFEDGVLNVPINILPDHEHLIHAERTEEWIKKWQLRYNWSDDFGKDSYYIKEWGEIVLSQLKYNEENSIDSVLIIHPITMYLTDNFEVIEQILKYISTKETAFIGDLIK